MLHVSMEFFQICIRRVIALGEPRKIKKNVRVLLGNRRCIHDPRIAVMRHHETVLRMLHREFIHIQRMGKTEQAARARKFARVNHDRKIMLCRKREIRFMQRIVQRNRIVARIKFQPDAVRFAELGVKKFQRTVHRFSRKLAALESGAMHQERRLRTVRQTRRRHALDPFAAHLSHCDAENDAAFIERGFQILRFVAVSRRTGDLVEAFTFGKMKMHVNNFHFE